MKYIVAIAIVLWSSVAIAELCDEVDCEGVLINGQQTTCREIDNEARCCVGDLCASMIAPTPAPTPAE